MTHHQPTPVGRAPRPLLGRAALVTGASRRAGIGYAVARRLAALGASVYLHHHVPHDAEQPWGADPEGPDRLLRDVAEPLAEGAGAAHGPADLTDPEAPARLVDTAAEALGGRLDILIANEGLPSGSSWISERRMAPGWQGAGSQFVLGRTRAIRQRGQPGCQASRAREDPKSRP